MADRALFHPESVELVPGRKKLERLPRQLRRGDREKVRRGKELLRWQYSASDWERHIIACSRRLVDPGELTTALAETALNASAIVLEDRHWRRKFELERGDDLVWKQLQDVVQPEEVLVTSTGILYGQLARLWGGRSCRFFSAESEGEEPTYLVFEFQKRWLFWWLGKTSLWVPLPRDVQADALLELIEPWLSTR